MNEKKLTMKDVATAVGCHVSTVSLALRGDERIPEVTRERVRLEAKRLGYQVHPLISAWNRSRRAGKSINCNLSLAYLGSRESERSFAAVAVFNSLQEEANRNGFSMTRFYIEDFVTNLGRLTEILKTRGVSGMIFGPGLESHRFEGADWSEFSLVAIGEGPADPLVDRFMADAGERVTAAFRSCVEQGYRRIGFVFTNSWRLVSGSCSIAAFNAAQGRYLAVDERIAVCYEPENAGAGQLDAWIRLNRPEVLLVDTEVGISLGSLDIPKQSDLYRNLEYDSLAEVTVECIGNLVVGNQRGVPDKRRSVLLETPQLAQGLSCLPDLSSVPERYFEVVQ